MFDLDAYHAKNALRWDFTAQAWGVMTPMFGRISFCVTLLALIGTNKVKKQLLWFTVSDILGVRILYVSLGHVLGSSDMLQEP